MPRRELPRLVVHDLLVARDWVHRRELSLLHEWWQAGGDGVAALIGIGGAGKTAIADRFVRAIPTQKDVTPEIPSDPALRPLSAIFVFSFYDEPNVEVFFSILTAWINGERYDESARRPTYAETLVALQQSGQDLLILLDGLEMVQDPGQRGGHLGQITEPSLRNFITSVAKGTFKNVSVLVTSRFKLYDVLAKGYSFLASYPVDKLDPETAVGLLRSRKVQGTKSQLKQLCKAQGYHALSVDLLGGYIARYCDGDAEHLQHDSLNKDIESVADDAVVNTEDGEYLDQQRRFARLARRYRQALEKHDQSALALLERVCLFRMGTDAETLHSIFSGKDKRSISGSQLAALDKKQISKKLSLLTEMRLIEKSRNNQYTAHPAVRDGFLKDLDPTGVRAIQEATAAGLEAKLASRPGDAFPEDLPSIDLLEEIVHHAILAGRASDAWAIYEQRLGGYRNLGWHLGLYERGERICRSFASSLGNDSVNLKVQLDNSKKSRLYNEWSLFLTDLGQIDKSVNCSEVAAGYAIQAVDKSICLLNLSEALCSRGLIPKAIEACLGACESAKGTYLLPVCSATLKHLQMLNGMAECGLHSIRAGLYWQNYHGKEIRESHVLHGALTIPSLSIIPLEGKNSHLLKAFSNRSTRRRDTSFGHLLRAEVHIRSGDFDLASADILHAREIAIETGANDLICLCACSEARIAGRKDAGHAEALQSINEAIDTSREYGYGLLHIDLLIHRAQLHLAQNETDEAIEDIETAIDRGASGEGSQNWASDMPAANAIHCNYRMVISVGDLLRAEAWLIQASSLIESTTFDVNNLSLLPPKAKELIERSAKLLKATLGKRRSAAIIERNAVNCPTFHHFLRSEEEAIEDLGNGILTRYGLAQINSEHVARHEQTLEQEDYTPKANKKVMASKTLTWLHLSDLHFRKSSEWDHNRVLESLVRDLNVCEKNFGLLPDFIFFTGDLAFGQIPGDSIDEQFKGALEFLEQIRHAFSRAVPELNTFIVPGNHDVNRQLVFLPETEWLDRFVSVDQARELMQGTGDVLERCMSRLGSYKNAILNGGYKHLVEQDDSRLIYSISRDVNGIAVNITGLNSAWTCCRNGENSKLWMAADWQLGELARRASSSDFSIALVHHPFDWLREEEQAANIWSRIESDFQVCMHGHEHTGWVKQIDEAHVRIASSACYERSEKENGYSFSRFNLEHGKGEVWLRRYASEGSGGWVPRVVPGKTNNDGLWPIKTIVADF